jgi:uncharacterized protein with PIN domain
MAEMVKLGKETHMDTTHSRLAGKSKQEKNNPSFQKNNKRRISCPKCGTKLAKKNGGVIYTYLGEKKSRPLECYSCGEKFIVCPPYKGIDKNGDEAWKYGATNKLLSTAVLTREDCDATVPVENPSKN